MRVRTTFRYVCTSCGSTQVYKRRKSRHRMADYSHYHCENCGFKCEEVYDKKNGINIGL